MAKLEAKEVVAWFRGDLTDEDRNLITGVLLDAVGALPLRDILYTDENSMELVVNGKPVDDMQIARNLRDSAKAALSNRAFNLIKEQVAYEAASQAARQVKTIQDLIFMRAALWWGEQVDQKLRLLAQQTQDADL